MNPVIKANTPFGALTKDSSSLSWHHDKTANIIPNPDNIPHICVNKLFFIV